MKKRKVSDHSRSDGFFVRDFTKGFLGEANEGGKMLAAMGLSPSQLPFSAVAFLRKRCAHWADSQGHVASIRFAAKHDQIECFGSYRGKKKSMRIFREWNNYESREMIARLESETIGEFCMKCIYELFNSK